jgi:hypothetical protein
VTDAVRVTLVVRDEDALAEIVGFLRSPKDPEVSTYGYDLYLPRVIDKYLLARGVKWGEELTALKKEHSPPFYSAAWDLCRRGIIRPGVAVYGHQSTDDGSAGGGFSVTTFGRQWLAESDRDDYVPTEPGRFAELTAQFTPRFGAGYHERAQEAFRCYGAHAYLACCAMCGAAAESILLAIAIARQGGNREGVLRTYNSSGGRGRVEREVTGGLPEPLRREFLGLAALLKYWRDEAAHGRESGIDDNEAYTSLALLLRFVLFADNRWSELTHTP